MNLDDVKKIKVPRKKRHRVGRGPGSGWGTTAGRGNKGAGQRSGTKFRLRFEGGQMPLYRRLPKMGFSNARFKVNIHVVNVGDLQSAFEAGSTVTLDALKRAGLAPKRADYVKILGFGDLDKNLEIVANGVSNGAREKIEAAKGSIKLLPVRTEMREKFVRKDGTSSKPGAAAKQAAAARKAAAPAKAPAAPKTNDSAGEGGEA
jgi:large subunit ribosomal protein L15